MEPPATSATTSGNSRIRVRLVTDFPEPDSPTTPRVWPSGMLMDTLSTAFTRPSSVWK